MMAQDIGAVVDWFDPILVPGVYVIIILIFLGTLLLILDYMRKEKKRKAEAVKGMKLMQIQPMSEIKPFRRPEQEANDQQPKP